MKKIQKKILAVILSAIVAFSMPTALAVDAYYNLPLDTGNHHRYSGGSRSRSRSRSNSRSRSRSYSSSGRSSSSSGSSEIDQKTAIILVIAFLVIFVSVFGLIIWCVKQPDKKSKKYKNIPPMFPYNATEQITEFIKQNDENFDTEQFLLWAKNIFITIQTAWAQRDWEKIRTIEKEELFEQHNTQLQEYIRLGRINIMENINVIDAYLHKLVIDENFENLTVSLRATMNDYIINEKNGKVLMGNKNEVFDTIYQMTFTRRKGIKTNLINGLIVNVCPHCGATVESASAGVCQYCGSVVHSGEFNWVLSNLESVDEHFVDEMRGIIFSNN
ncbi:TIM44-like domain-containing protein [Pseudoruminococcus massiliensis]|uniref:TIM44-like domain-containing protein n=1 Tax=Pseudoruminococcus massiliensis TaxID=2086583 RepID=UPI000D0F6373|nr:TIM44-like domain-containing protein [Pseudoruminococcus massiliensis]